jgi:hypothetical protein
MARKIYKFRNVELIRKQTVFSKATDACTGCFFAKADRVLWGDCLSELNEVWNYPCVKGQQHYIFIELKSNKK